jgi:hypothetical protein
MIQYDLDDGKRIVEEHEHFVEVFEMNWNDGGWDSPGFGRPGDGWDGGWDDDPFGPEPGADDSASEGFFGSIWSFIRGIHMLVWIGIGAGVVIAAGITVTVIVRLRRRRDMSFDE